jgi:hypothetical protein
MKVQVVRRAGNVLTRCEALHEGLCHMEYLTHRRGKRLCCLLHKGRYMFPIWLDHCRHPREQQSVEKTELACLCVSCYVALPACLSAL